MPLSGIRELAAFPWANATQTRRAAGTYMCAAARRFLPRLVPRVGRESHPKVQGL